MSVWSWLKLTVCLWLLRKMIKAGGWLLLAALAVAAWPVTIIVATGYGTAWLRGWPPARLRRGPRRHHRLDHLVRADRAPGPRTPAGTVRKGQWWTAARRAE